MPAMDTGRTIVNTSYCFIFCVKVRIILFLLKFPYISIYFVFSIEQTNLIIYMYKL